MLENPINNMFKHEGKIVNIIGKTRIKTYKELYNYLEDLQNQDSYLRPQDSNTKSQISDKYLKAE